MSRSSVRAAAVWALALAAPLLQATNLDLRIQSGGQGSVTVSPGAVVAYSVVGELSDGLSSGLALFSVDLSFSGGALVPASAPGSAPMLSFATPAGLNNPAGFGGTVKGGQLLQVGGGQNTIKSTFAPFPNGTVVTGVAQQGSPITLVSGSLTAPSLPGSYTLTPSGLVANVIHSGATGNPVWKVEPAGSGTLLGLTVNVQSPATERGPSARKAKP